jgi:uncharacterized protein YqeY
MNTFSSIFKNKAQGSEDCFELLEWPRPILVEPLTHTGIKPTSLGKKVLLPILLGEYESFKNSKLNFINWLKICNIPETNADKIAQATVSLQLTLNTLGHKIDISLISNWATTVEQNWPKNLPTSENNTTLIEKIPIKFREKVLSEYGHFLKNGKNALAFILNKEIKIFLKFLHKRSKYDNLSAIIRICWHARKELGMWSRTWFDGLIITAEQTLEPKNFPTKQSNNRSLLLDNNNWTENVLPLEITAKNNQGLNISSAKKFSKLNITRRKQLEEKAELNSDSDESLEDTNVQNTRFGDIPKNKPIKWNLLKNAKPALVELMF